MPSPTSARPVSMASVKASGWRSPDSVVPTAPAGVGQVMASAISSRHSRSSASNPPGRSVSTRRQPPPSPRTGRTASEKPLDGTCRDSAVPANSSGPIHTASPARWASATGEPPAAG